MQVCVKNVIVTTIGHSTKQQTVVIVNKNSIKMELLAWLAQKHAKHAPMILLVKVAPPLILIR
jgi:hypothetical protein